MDYIEIDGASLTLEDVVNVARGGLSVRLADRAIESINKSREYVERLVEEGKVVYGITTGFGKFSDVIISKEESAQLQRNLIISHACGVGKHLEPEAVRAVMLLRANALSRGYSGVRLNTLQTLIDMLNKNIIPAIPEKGSLGASGDLAPLSHMVLTLIGEGECYYGGKLMDSSEAMGQAGIEPVTLTSKEGLALINGTQVMTAIGALALWDAINLLKLADISASLTIEALNGITDAFHPSLHSVRPHKGQMNTAQNLLRILDGSQRTTRQGEIKVQDAYSIRCIPQVHGASKDAINYIKEKVEIEINSVTDNPVIVTDLDMAISCGNFHGQPMALSFDFLAIAAAEIANIAERRIERLVNPQLSGLPAFLTEHGGLHSGFMIAQYCAAALVSENKVLAHPASVDSIPSSANQEDHVSMGTIAARKAAEVCTNAYHVLAIELIAACQAIDMNKKFQDKPLGKGTNAAYTVLRGAVPYISEDTLMYKLFKEASGVMSSGKIINAVEEAIGVL